MSNQTKSKYRVKKYGEVYTNEREVKAMCDLIPKETWDNLSSTFLEPACGNGNFLIEIIKRKLSRCNTQKDVETAYSSVFGIDILIDNVKESKKRMLVLDKNIICGDSLKIMEEMSK